MVLWTRQGRSQCEEKMVKAWPFTHIIFLWQSNRFKWWVHSGPNVLIMDNDEPALMLKFKLTLVRIVIESWRRTTRPCEPILMCLCGKQYPQYPYKWCNRCGSCSIGSLKLHGGPNSPHEVIAEWLSQWSKSTEPSYDGIAGMPTHLMM